MDQQRLEIQQLKEALERFEGQMRNIPTTTAAGRRQRDLASHKIYGKLDIVERDEDGQIAEYTFKKGILDKYLTKVGEGRPVMAKNLMTEIFSRQERKESNVNGKYNKPPLESPGYGSSEGSLFPPLPCCSRESRAPMEGMCHQNWQGQ